MVCSEILKLPPGWASLTLNQNCFSPPPTSLAVVPKTRLPIIAAPVSRRMLTVETPAPLWSRLCARRSCSSPFELNCLWKGTARVLHFREAGARNLPGRIATSVPEAEKVEAESRKRQEVFLLEGKEAASSFFRSLQVSLSLNDHLTKPILGFQALNKTQSGGSCKAQAYCLR